MPSWLSKQQLTVLFLLITYGCHLGDTSEIVIHGHRGCRGLWPENSMKAFEEAIRWGATTIELDVVITRDREILVSHDPYMHHEICSKPDFSDISAEEELALNIFEMDAATAQSFWIGTKPHPRFPGQHQFASHKPLLTDAVNHLSHFAADVLDNEKPVNWNIEIKSKPEWDGLFHPPAAEYARDFLKKFSEIKNCGRCIIQSFDARILEALHRLSPGLRLVYLDEGTSNVDEKLAELTFKPFGYSPQFQKVTEHTVKYCRENQLALIVWTVNELADLRRLMQMGVTEIITDYPDRLQRLIAEQ